MPKKEAVTVGQAEAVETAVVIPEHIEKELMLLRGFRDLVAERVAYSMGVQAINEEAREKTESERKAVNEARKYLKENLETFIANADMEGYKNALSQIEKASKALREARKPFLEKITPLRRGINYIDKVAVPQSLETLGVKVQPRFSLSDYIAKAIEERKKKARKK